MIVIIKKAGIRSDYGYQNEDAVSLSLSLSLSFFISPLSVPRELGANLVQVSHPTAEPQISNLEAADG